MNKIAIIGSGVSGSLLAINLIKKHRGEKLMIYMIEKDYDRFNKGVAYSTMEMSHLLNVRAAGMSIYKDEPMHFKNWLNKNNYGYGANDFVPRRIFADYVSSEFEKVVASKNDDVYLTVMSDEVVDIDLNGYSVVKLKSGTALLVDIAVLALGHISVSEIDTLKYSGIHKYFRTPWDNSIYDKIQQTDNVLLIGSGLTTDDVILSLTKRKHAGKIYSLSRSGLQPVAHEIIEPYPAFGDELLGQDINTMFSIFRKHLKLAKNPRSVVDALRPHSQKIWKSLSQTDKSRFLRHLNKYWNVIRHRMPESTYETLSKLEKNGTLDFITGRITSIIDDGGDIKVTYFNKVIGTETELRVDAIVNCIGPESNYKRIAMPLIKNLLEKGIIKQNETGISIKASDWCVIGNDNQVQTGLLAIGPLLKGELFESTAVPELKVQSDELADYILKNI